MAHTIKGARSGDALERNILSMTADSTPLLKFGEGGKPGFRPFQLSNDLLALTWHSKTKAADKTRVMIKDMKELRYGQRTDKFKKSNRSDLTNLSFSVMFMEKEKGGVMESLDLVCKDEPEFQTWTSTIETLIEGKADLTPYLLAIQKRQLAEQGKTDVDSSDAAKRARKQKQLMSKKGGGKENEANDVYAFGWGEWGQNGIGQNLSEMDSCPNPKLLESLLGKHVVQIAQGWSHSAVLLESGELLQYGNRIGTGLNEDYVNPTPTVINTNTAAPAAVAARGSVSVSGAQSIVSLSCGGFHTTALTERGQVLSFGSSVNGQLGHGDRRDVKDPRFIEFLRAPGQEVFVVSVVCGGSFTALLSDEGAVYTFGCGQHGVLGHNDVRDRELPTRVQDLAGTEIQKIAAGDCHMFACTVRETYAWGWNACSQLGLGSEEDQHRPHVVEALRGSEIKEIAAGALHSVAIVHVIKMKSDILFSWGSNACGQAGQGKKNKLARPTPVPELRGTSNSNAVDSPVVEIKCGSFHTLIRTSNGEVLATGSNKYGQCGFIPGAASAKAAAAAANTSASSSDVSAISEQLDEFRIVDSLKDKIARSLCCGGENSSVLTARAWVEDSEATECMSCKSAFTFVNRKHHCRNCGGIFCGACSSKKIAILRIQVTEPVRVCVSCYTMLGGR